MVVAAVLAVVSRVVRVTSASREAEIMSVEEEDRARYKEKSESVSKVELLDEQGLYPRACHENKKSAREREKWSLRHGECLIVGFVEEGKLTSLV